MGRARRIGLLAAGAFVALLIVSASLAEFYTDVLWFEDLGHGGVFWTSLAWRWAVGASSPSSRSRSSS